mgnify:CR=1 FL=1
MSGARGRALTPLEANERARAVLVGSALVTAVLYVVPYGHTIGYPLMLLSTLAHEMGHGVAAMLVGGHFEDFHMWADGSGVARSMVPTGRVTHALVAAGGLVGPALVAAVGFFIGRYPVRARRGLLVASIVMALALVVVVRGAFGMFFVAATAAACAAVAVRAPPWASQVTVLFLAAQLALSVFSRGDYLFTDTAQTSTGLMPSDVAQIANNLWLPYWFWGALCGAFSVAVLVLGIVLLWRAPQVTRGGDAAPR